MVIWQTEASIEYLRLANAVERDVRQTLDYTRGKLSKWQPLYVNYDTDVYDDTDERHERISDFATLSGRIICDEVARSMLDELVKDHIDFLPLLSDTITDRRLYILHPITELDCLDSERSEFSRLSSGYIMASSDINLSRIVLVTSRSLNCLAIQELDPTSMTNSSNLLKTTT